MSVFAPAVAPIEAVILDMDGTLLDTERMYKTCTLETLVELGWGEHHGLIYEMVGLSSTKCDALLMARLGPDFPLDTYHARFQVRREAVASHGIALKPGAISLLDRLASARFPMAIATSSSRVAAERHLTAAGIRDRFETVVTVDDVLEAKPNPEVYLSAAARLGVQPHACIAIEDSTAGVLAATSARMITLMVPDMNIPESTVANLCAAVCTDLFEVERWLLERVPAMRVNTVAS